MGESKPQSALESAEKWMENQGYPLEYRCAAAFHKTGFVPDQSAYIYSASEVLREVDLLATRSTEVAVRPDGFPVEAVYQVLVECKSSKKSPWIILGSPFDSVQREAQLEEVFRSYFLNDAVLATSQVSLARIESCISRDVQHGIGHSLVRAHDSNQDLGYEILCKIVDLSAAAADLIYDPVDPPRANRYGFVIPCVVVSAPLFYSRFDIKTGKVNLLPAQCGRVLWSGTPGQGSAIVDIITEQYVDRYARVASVMADKLAASVRHYVQEISLGTDV